MMGVIDDYQINAEGLVIRGRPEVAEPGLYIGEGGFAGWDDGGGDSRSDAPARQGSHGDFDEDITIGPRVASVDGIVLANSPAELEVFRKQITGHGRHGKRMLVEVKARGNTLHAYGRRGSTPEFKDSGRTYGLLSATFFLQWVFADPRKLGPTVSFPESFTTGGTIGVDVWHDGNADAIATIEVRGPHPNGYSVSTPGSRYDVVAPLAAGSVDVIDLGTGFLYRNGVMQSGVWGSRADVFTIPPEGARVSLTTTGTGGFRVLVPYTDI